MLAAVESSLSNPSAHPSAGSILVVDDENASGELIATLLRSQGYAVRLLNEGKQALEQIAGGGVELVLLDLMMSRMDGVEICAHVRNELRDPVLPIVIVTSLNDRESRIRAKEAGADDVLVKPIDGLELLVRIDTLLRARAHYRQLERERDRLRDELTRARTTIGSQQRALRTIANASDQLRELVERERERLQGAYRRWEQVPEAREDMRHLSELAAELADSLEIFSGAASGTIVRVHEEEGSSEARPPHSATK